MATAPNKALLDDPQVLTVDLDGTKWPIPKLAPKQNEIIVPLVLELIPRLTDSVRHLGGQVRMDLERLAQALTAKGTRDVYTILYWSLQRGHRELTREEFDEMPIGILDAIEAVMTISKQTGVIRAAKPGEPTLGEEAAAA